MAEGVRDQVPQHNRLPKGSSSKPGKSMDGKLPISAASVFLGGGEMMFTFSGILEDRYPQANYHPISVTSLPCLTPLVCLTT